MAIYIKSTLNYLPHYDIQKRCSDKGIEAVVVEIVSKSPVFTIVLYRPPQSKVDWFDNLADVISEISALGRIVLLGDLNADVLKPTEYPGKTLLNVLEAGNLSLSDHIEPTRVCKSSSTALDIIAVDNDLVLVSYMTLSTLISDHFPVSAVIQIEHSKSRVQPIKVRSFKNVDRVELSRRILSISVNPLSNCNDATDDWYQDVNSILDEMAPYRNKPMRVNRSPYVTPEIKELMHKRDRLARRAKKQNLSTEEWDQLRIYKRSITSRMRRLAKEEGKLASQNTNNPSEAWKYINRFMCSTKGHSKLHISPSALNDHFGSIVRDPTSSELCPPEFCVNSNCFTFQPVQEAEVFHTLQSLKSRSASGHDGLTSIVLKERTRWCILAKLDISF